MLTSGVKKTALRNLALVPNKLFFNSPCCNFKYRMLTADIHILHRSEFYHVNDFKCHCDRCSVSQPEYNKSMFISFVRKGFFEFQTFRRNDEMHVGRMLISKPGYEHTTRHIESQPDLTTSF